ncbi:MAG: hypothetical protein ACE5EH_06600 [Gammaproteobacteria bacterium]
MMLPIKHKLISLAGFIFFLTFITGTCAQVPLMINFQGKVDVAGVPHNGSGYFKFSLIDDPVTPSTNYWVSDSSVVIPGAEPGASVMIPVNQGLFTVKLGDANLTNMSAITPAIFSNATLYLRTWFSSDGTAFEMLAPDRQLVSVPFAINAESANSIASGAITNAEISATAAISTSKLDTAGTTNLVSKIIAGSGVTISPVSGVGDVTITVSGGGGGTASDVVCTNCVESSDITDGTVATADLAFDPATQAELDAHKTSADHDSRYYTEAELNTSDGDAPNAGSNKVHWDNLTGVPAGFADGVDDNAGGSGTVTNIATGAGLTGGPITTTGTVSVATGGITSTMIADGTVTVTDMAIDPVEETELDTMAELQTKIADATVVSTTMIDTKGELESVLTDVTDLALASGDTFTGDLTLGKTTDPSLVFTPSGVDTDFWLGVQDDNLGTDDDRFQIGVGSTPGSNQYLTILSTGNVGIGAAATSPGATLDVAGQIKIRGGAPGAGKVLTTDASGLATWTTPAGTGDVTAVGDCTSNDCFTGTSGSTLTSSSSEILDMSVDGSLIYQRNNAGAVTFAGKDDAGAANTIYDTTGAGAITVGSADVTSVTISTDGTGDAEVVLPTGSIGSGEILDGSIALGDAAFDPIVETELDTMAELQAKIVDATVLDSTMIDTKGELETLLTDVTDLAMASGDIFTGAHDFGGATSVEIPNSTAPVLTADGQIALESDADAINIQAGSGGVGGVPANTDVALPLIQQKDITLVEPDQVQTVSDAVPFFAVDAYNFPNGITITAIRLATSASSTLAINVEEWTSPTDGAPVTIDAIATSASAEVTETTITDAAVAAGSYVFLDLDTTNVNWAKVTVWYYVND